MNKNIVATISHNGYKDFFLNRKCLWHSMNKIQSKNHSIEIFEINQFYLSSFDYKNYILDNKIDLLALGA